MFIPNLDKVSKKDEVFANIFKRINIISEMQKKIDEILPPICKNYVRVLNFSPQKIVLHVANGIMSGKIRNLSGRISNKLLQNFKNYSNCQLEIYVHPQTINNYLKISNPLINNNNKTKNKIFSYKNESLENLSKQTLNDLRSLSNKMSLNPQLKAALDRIIIRKSQRNLQFFITNSPNNDSKTL